MSCNCCEHTHCHTHSDEAEESKLVIFRLVLGSIIFACGIFLKLNLLHIVAYIILGYDVIFNAVKNYKHLFNESFLMSIATIGAFALGEYPEAVAVMLFYQLGEFLSDYAVDKSTDSIQDLMDLRVDTAKVLKNNTITETHCEEVNIGDTIIVSAGEKIPLDGVISNGSAYVDLSALTGESLPVFLQTGDSVMSGSINTDSKLEIEVTKSYTDSTASKILELVNNEKRSHSEKFITKFAKIYTPIVVILALIIAVIPPIFTGTWREWLYTALLFLVVSCPCALVVSVPLTFFSGIGCASKNGILIKGAYVLEKLSKVTKIAFDKTGTLTKGNFALTGIRTTNSAKQEVLEYAAYCEFYSGHPIGKAIVKAYNKDIDQNRIQSYSETAGQGVSALIDGHSILVGTSDFVGADSSKKIVSVQKDGVYIGYIELSDTLKSESLHSIKKLKKAGIIPVMLTGDSDSNAKPIASELDIDYYAALLPQDKVQSVNRLKAEGIVAFVGDGINDAPVLSTADVGISMGGIGSDAAIEASDAVLMNDDISKIPLSIKISKKTLSIVWQNIVFAIGVKIIIMVLGILGIASMWLAVFADVGVCILAVLNSLRAFKIRD